MMQPVLETYTPDGFDLWPVAEVESFGFLPLSGELSPDEVGAAVMRIADCNDVSAMDGPDGGHTPHPAGPLDSFLHGLLTLDDPIASGGLRVIDDSTGGFGHDPVSPTAERFGDTVRLTVNIEENDSPVIELGVPELRHLLVGVERDLTGFLALAAEWSSAHLPDHCTAVTAAVARSLDLPAPGPTA
ncbi:hypothetical protein [Streptomyces venezuelae]